MILAKLSSKKKMRNTMFIAFFLIICLIARIGYIQFVKGEELSTLAYEQQTLDRTINPKRGTIYDRTRKNALAISSTVETVTVNPGNIAKENKEKVAKKLSEIFELDYDTVYKKVTKRSDETKKQLTNRLNRIEGQIRGIKKMIDEDRYCNDVLIQLSAVEASLKSLSNNILETHLYTCISEDIEKGNIEVVDELVSLFKRFNKY